MPTSKSRQRSTSKRQRQYEHIKQSSRERGESPRRAKEIAARTVNKEERQAGRQPPGRISGGSRSGRGRGGGGGRAGGRRGGAESDLQQRTVQELRDIASRRDIPGRSRMSKHELVQAIREHA